MQLLHYLRHIPVKYFTCCNAVIQTLNIIKLLSFSEETCIAPNAECMIRFSIGRQGQFFLFKKA